MGWVWVGYIFPHFPMTSEQPSFIYSAVRYSSSCVVGSLCSHQTTTLSLSTRVDGSKLMTNNEYSWNRGCTRKRRIIPLGFPLPPTPLFVLSNDVLFTSAPDLQGFSNSCTWSLANPWQIKIVYFLCCSATEPPTTNDFSFCIKAHFLIILRRFRVLHYYGRSMVDGWRWWWRSREEKYTAQKHANIPDRIINLIYSQDSWQCAAGIRLLLLSTRRSIKFPFIPSHLFSVTTHERENEVPLNVYHPPIISWLQLGGLSCWWDVT